MIIIIIILGKINKFFCLLPSIFVVFFFAVFCWFRLSSSKSVCISLCMLVYKIEWISFQLFGNLLFLFLFDLCATSLSQRLNVAPILQIGVGLNGEAQQLAVELLAFGTFLLFLFARILSVSSRCELVWVFIGMLMLLFTAYLQFMIHFCT